MKFPSHLVSCFVPPGRSRSFARSATILLLLSLLLPFFATIVWAAPARSLLLVFPISVVESTASARNRDARSLGYARSLRAARALRDQFKENNAADVLLYDPEAPMIARALIENKIAADKAAEPTLEERFAVAKSVGATHVVLVLSAPDTQGNLVVELQTAEVGSRKRWAASTRVVPTSALPGSIQSGNDTASAVRILMLRFLGEPLKEYVRGALPAELVPAASENPLPNVAEPAPPPPLKPVPAPAAPTPKPEPTKQSEPVKPKPVKEPEPTKPETVKQPVSTTPPTKPISQPSAIVTEPAATTSATLPATRPDAILQPGAEEEDDETRALREQADSLIGAGDVNAAILLLRRAVNRAPLMMAARADLVRAYLLAKRSGDAASEARRALSLASGDAARQDLIARINEALAKSDNPQAAQNIYSEILATDASATWARAARADLLRAMGKQAEAEREYRAILQGDKTNRIAREGLGVLLADRGELRDALDAMTGGRNGAVDRATEAGVLFDRIAPRILENLLDNRRAWQQSGLSREGLYRATQRQQVRLATLATLLRDTEPPAANRDQVLVTKHRRRLLATGFLATAAQSVLTFLETNESSAMDRANVGIANYRREMAALGVGSATASVSETSVARPQP